MASPSQSSSKLVVYLSVPETGHLVPAIPFLRYLVETDAELQLVIMGTPAIEPLMSAFPPHRAALHLFVDDTGKPINPFEGPHMPAKCLFTQYHNIYSPLLKQLRQLTPSLLLFDTFFIFGAALAHDLGIPSVSFFTHPVLEEESLRPYSPIFLKGVESIYETFLSDYPHLKESIKGPHLIAHRNFGTLQFIFSIPELHTPLISIEAELTLDKRSTLHFIGPTGIKKDTRQMPIEKSPPSSSSSSSSLPAASMTNLNNSLTDDLPWDYLDSHKDKKLILVSMGTVVPNAKEVFTLVLDVLRSFPDVLVVVAVGKSISSYDELGQISNHFIIRRFIPQLLLLPRSSLFITHGGYNSINEAAYHGVPLIVFPQFGDQPINAAMVGKLGIGVGMEKIIDKDAPPSLPAEGPPSTPSKWDGKMFEAAVKSIMTEEKYKLASLALQQRAKVGLEEGMARGASLIKELVNPKK